MRVDRRLGGIGGLLLGVVLTAVAAAEPGAADTPKGRIEALLKTGSDSRLRWGRVPDFRTRIENLYAQRGYRPLWVQEGRPVPQSSEIVACLGQAETKGLRRGDYDVDRLGIWVDRLDAGGAVDAEQVALFDVAMTLAVARYATHLSTGRIHPRKVNFGFDTERKKVDLAALMAAILQDPHPCGSISALEPKISFYRALIGALARYRGLAEKIGPMDIPLPAKLEPGDRHPDVPTLRTLLVSLGDLAPDAASPRDPEVYSGAIVEAVKRFQIRHGLTPDSVVGKATQAALKVPLTARVRQIELGLERLRWLPEPPGGPYLLVNIPSFHLFGYRNGADEERPDLVMNIIVGQAVSGRATPIFHSDMTYIVFRPYWNVPYGITVKEMLPGILKSPDYLARHDLEIVPGFGSGVPVYEADWGTIQGLSSGALRLRQRPGPKNALGLVKFAFPNTDNIYLHGTPSRNLFQRSRRDFSHGCIRVEDPVGLAEFVLERQGGWTRERIEQAMNGSQSKIVTLKYPVPVYLFYSTVLLGPDGEVQFFQDIYGHDRVLEDLLAREFPPIDPEGKVP
ncbi:MAG TPA: L,D-transpeptidase family protein [Methylococcus sp.]|nr:L,D-transpeptidase family protein [Methylococcus sp.]